MYIVRKFCFNFKNKYKKKCLRNKAIGQNLQTNLNKLYTIFFKFEYYYCDFIASLINKQNQIPLKYYEIIQWKFVCDY